MKKKIIIIASASLCVLCLVFALLFIDFSGETRPFENFDLDDIRTVTVTYSGSNKRYLLTNFSDLAEHLSAVTVYEEGEADSEGDERYVTFKIDMKKADDLTVTAYNSCIELNGVCYKADADTCAKLISYGDGITDGNNAALYMDSPPALLVTIADGKSAAAALGTYSWSCGGTGLEVDSTLPVRYDLLTPIVTESDTAVFDFDAEPSSSVRVYCMSTEDLDNELYNEIELKVENGEFELLEGDYVYTINAGWSSGNAYYHVYIKKS